MHISCTCIPIYITYRHTCVTYTHTASNSTSMQSESESEVAQLSIKNNLVNIKLFECIQLINNHI